MNVKELFDIKGKKAIVTGGGRGIGSFIAAGLAEAGADLVIASRKIQNLEKEAEELRKLGVKAIPVKCDMESKEDIDNLVKTAVQEFGTIDILVNNAGLTWGAPTLDFPLDKWDKIFNVNVRGLWILTQQVAKIMKDKGRRQDNQHLLDLRLARVTRNSASRGALQLHEGGGRDPHQEPGGQARAVQDIGQRHCPRLFPYRHDGIRVQAGDEAASWTPW